MLSRATQLRLFGLYCKLHAVRGLDAVGEVALRAFLRPPRPRISERQAAFLDGGRPRRLSLAGFEVFAYEWGDPGAPYVFTDIGWGYNAGRWRRVTPALTAGGYRVVAFDPPGHGRSPYAACPYPLRVALQRAVIAHFGPPALALCHSFGAGALPETLAGLPAGRRPARVASLAAFSDLRYLFRQYAAALGFGRVAWLSLARAVREVAGRSIGVMEPARAARGLLGVSALLAHDPEDAVTGFSNAERLHAHWPGALLYAARGAGHHFGPGEATDAVLAWLLEGRVPAGAKGAGGGALANAGHALAEPFRGLELDVAHGSHRSGYFG